MGGSLTLDEARPAVSGPSAPADGIAGGRPTRAAHRARRRSWRPLWLAGGVYLLVAVGLCWHLWLSHPTTTTLCGCGDPSLFTWFLEWPAHAIAHGLDPFYSTAMLHPTGVNLLANTSELALGVVLAPVTWAFGPVATLNVALTLSPVLSGLAMFVLLRRWTTWAPAAFIGGLLYGFSPSIVGNLANAHLMVAFGPVLPLMVLCLDDLLIRQRRRPLAVGVALGVLVTLQFFIGTEVLLIAVVTGAIGIAMVVLYQAVHDASELRRRLGYGLRGLGAALATGLVLLAYPVWFALAGPARLSGLVWPTIQPGLYGINFASLVQLDASSGQAEARFGGYLGPPFHQANYLGVGLIAVVIFGLLWWRRDRRLWLFGAVGVVTVALSLTVKRQENPFWVPWDVLRHLPVIRNIFPNRFVAMTFLCLSVMLAVIVDRSRQAILTRRATPAGSHPGRSGRGSPPGPRVAAGTVAAVIALVALVPIATSYVGDVPLTARPVVLPDWFRSAAPRLPPGQVVLSYPSPFGGFQSVLTWQAVDRMSFALAEGGGPGAILSRAGAHKVAFAALAGASFELVPSTAYTAATIGAVRHALEAWGVTWVVIPDQPELPAYEQGFHTAYAVGLMTAAIGAAPVYSARAWTWQLPRDRSTERAPDPTQFKSCVGSGNFPAGPPPTVPDCILAGSNTAPTG